MTVSELIYVWISYRKLILLAFCWTSDSNEKSKISVYHIPFGISVFSCFLFLKYFEKKYCRSTEQSFNNPLVYFGYYAFGAWFFQLLYVSILTHMKLFEERWTRNGHWDRSAYIPGTRVRGHFWNTNRAMVPLTIVIPIRTSWSQLSRGDADLMSSSRPSTLRYRRRRTWSRAVVSWPFELRCRHPAGGGGGGLGLGLKDE